MPQGVRILVVDDDENIRRTLGVLLRQSGYSVDTAGSGEEAIAKSDASFYNLALIDVRLPDIEGTELLSRLKETTPRMMKVILTGYPILESAIQAINRGVDGYLSKPVSTEHLLRTVSLLLDRQARERVFAEERLQHYIETRFTSGREVGSEMTEEVA